MREDSSGHLIRATAGRGQEESCNRFRAHVPVRLQPPHCIRNQACGRYHGLDGHRAHHRFISWSCDNRRRGPIGTRQYQHDTPSEDHLFLEKARPSPVAKMASRLGQFEWEAGSRVLCIGNATQLARRPRDQRPGFLCLVSLWSMSLHSTSM